MDAFTFFVLTLAAYRVVRMITAERGPFNVFYKLRAAFGRNDEDLKQDITTRIGTETAKKMLSLYSGQAKFTPHGPKRTWDVGGEFPGFGGAGLPPGMVPMDTDSLADKIPDPPPAASLWEDGIRCPHCVGVWAALAVMLMYWGLSAFTGTAFLFFVPLGAAGAISYIFDHK